MHILFKFHTYNTDLLGFGVQDFTSFAGQNSTTEHKREEGKVAKW